MEVMPLVVMTLVGMSLVVMTLVGLSLVLMLQVVIALFQHVTLQCCSTVHAVLQHVAVLSHVAVLQHIAVKVLQDGCLDIEPGR